MMDVEPATTTPHTGELVRFTPDETQMVKSDSSSRIDTYELTLSRLIRQIDDMQSDISKILDFLQLGSRGRSCSPNKKRSHSTNRHLRLYAPELKRRRLSRSRSPQREADDEDSECSIERQTCTKCEFDRPLTWFLSTRNRWRGATVRRGVREKRRVCKKCKAEASKQYRSMRHQKK
jgi:hypothetical protein